MRVPYGYGFCIEATRVRGSAHAVFHKREETWDPLAATYNYIQQEGKSTMVASDTCTIILAGVLTSLEKSWNQAISYFGGKNSSSTGMLVGVLEACSAHISPPASSPPSLSLSIILYETMPWELQAIRTYHCRLITRAGCRQCCHHTTKPNFLFSRIGVDMFLLGKCAMYFSTHTCQTLQEKVSEQSSLVVIHCTCWATPESILWGTSLSMDKSYWGMRGTEVWDKMYLVCVLHCAMSNNNNKQHSCCHWSPELCM